MTHSGSCIVVVTIVFFGFCFIVFVYVPFLYLCISCLFCFCACVVVAVVFFAFFVSALSLCLYPFPVRSLSSVLFNCFIILSLCLPCIYLLHFQYRCSFLYISFCQSACLVPLLFSPSPPLSLHLKRPATNQQSRARKPSNQSARTHKSIENTRLMATVQSSRAARQHHEPPPAPTLTPHCPTPTALLEKRVQYSYRCHSLVFSSGHLARNSTEHSALQECNIT